MSEQQLLRLDFEQRSTVDTSGLLTQVEQALPECDVVILSDYGKVRSTKWSG